MEAESTVKHLKVTVSNFHSLLKMTYWRILIFGIHVFIIY